MFLYRELYIIISWQYHAQM